MPNNNFNRIARKAIPAFVIAGLGLTLQTVPVMAESATGVIVAADDQPAGATMGAVTGMDGDSITGSYETLQDALSKGHDEIHVNENLTQNLEIDPDHSASQNTIVMNGHTLTGTSTTEPTISNKGMVEIRNTSAEGENACPGAIQSADSNPSNPVITTSSTSQLSLYDINVTGTIENNGYLTIQGGKYTGTINNVGGYLHIYGGDFTDATINNENYRDTFIVEGGTFPASWTPDQITSNLGSNNYAKQNEDSSWTVYTFGDGAQRLGPGIYYLKNADSAAIPDDYIEEGCRVIYRSYDSIEVVIDEFDESIVCYVENNGSVTGKYTSIDEALKNAKSRDYIILRKDIITDKPIVVPYGVSIEGEFHSITLTADIDSEAFITVDGNNPAVGEPSGCHFTHLTVDAGEHCPAAMLIDDNDEFVDVSNCELKGGKVYGAIVDSSYIAFVFTGIYPGEGARATINYRKHGTGWVRLATLDCTWSSSQAGVYIEPNDLLEIMNDANAEGAVLSTPQQAVCWLNDKDIIHPGIYYWPNDQHAESNKPADIDESVTVNSTVHGTASSTTCKEDETATLTVKPDDGYHVGTISVLDMYGNKVDCKAGADGTYTYTMPYGGVTITVTFAANGSSTVDPTPTPTPDPDPDPEPEPAPDQDVDVPETEGGTVKVDPVPAGETTTVETDPDAGQEVREVIVTDSEGNEIETAVDENGNVTFEMPEGGATVEVVFGCDGGDLCASHAFGDVTHDDWFHDDVDWAVKQGIFHGYDGGTFGPNDTLTREQAATVMYNYFGGGAGAPSTGMPDVDSSQWYADAVNWAVESGVMTGYSDTGEFGIGDALSREQFCAVVAKAMGADLSGVDTSVLDRFADAGTVSDWAKPAVAWAVQQGIMNGVENADGTRSLQGVRSLTRAEMATMMKNAVDAGVLQK